MAALEMRPQAARGPHECHGRYGPPCASCWIKRWVAKIENILPRVCPSNPNFPSLYFRTQKKLTTMRRGEKINKQQWGRPQKLDPSNEEMKEGGSIVHRTEILGACYI